MSAPKTLSASAIASLNLPGFPETKRSINRVAAREGWAFVEGPNNTREYTISLMPDHRAACIRAALPSQIRTVPSDAADSKRRAGRPSGTDFFAKNPEVADSVVAILMRQKIAATRVMELLQTLFGDNLPSARALRRFILKVEREKPALLASVRDPDLYKSKYRISLGRADADVSRANQVWELDTTKADVMTKGGRVMILGCIDRWSRRAMFMVAPSESAQSVRRLLVRTMRAWGVQPERIVVDNGSGYKNETIKSALEHLDIDLEFCLPGTPEKKPFVERVFGTFTRERSEMLPGYSGHNVSDAQRLRGAAKKKTGRAEILAQIDGEQLQVILDNWVDGVYNQRTHSSIKMAPITKWLSSPEPSRAAPSEDALKVALSVLVGTVTVGKRGIRWKHGRYWATELLPYVGRPVLIRRDEDDLGALFVLDQDRRFICTAINVSRSGFTEQQFASAAHEQQKKYMKEARAEARARSTLKIDVAQDLVLRNDALSAGKLTVLNPHVKPHSTPLTASVDELNTPVIPAAVPSIVRADFVGSRAVPAVGMRTTGPKAEKVIADHEAGHEVAPERLAWARYIVSSQAYHDFREHNPADGSAPKVLSFPINHRSK